MSKNEYIKRRNSYQDKNNKNKEYFLNDSEYYFKQAQHITDPETGQLIHQFVFEKSPFMNGGKKRRSTRRRKVRRNKTRRGQRRF
jgi:hypothetical protein